MSNWAKLIGEDLVMRNLGAIGEEPDDREAHRPHSAIEAIRNILFENHLEGGNPEDPLGEILGADGESTEFDAE